MTADLYALRDGGSASWTRTPAQWQVGSTRRPVVEWYDSLLDPWEVRNLAEEHDLPGDRTERLSWLGGLLTTRGLGGAVDLGLIDDEAAMVAEHLWPPDGAQPTTAAPVLEADGRLSCATEGGLIAVRMDGIWRPYDGAPPPVARSWARAPRGLQASAVVTSAPETPRRRAGPGASGERGVATATRRRARTRSGGAQVAATPSHVAHRRGLGGATAHMTWRASGPRASPPGTSGMHAIGHRTPRAAALLARGKPTLPPGGQLEGQPRS